MTSAIKLLLFPLAGAFLYAAHMKTVFVSDTIIWRAEKHSSITHKKVISKIDTAEYSIAQVNYIGMNYNENLLDLRNNITSYTHLSSNSNKEDAWHLHFPDDAARFLEGVAFEADYSPVARIELARRLSKGLIAAHVPGTKAYYNFRHRSGGKTELIFSNEKSDPNGRVMLSTWGDEISGEVKVGFRAKFGSEWHDIQDFKHQTPGDGGDPYVARSSVNWNKSPYSFTKHFDQSGKNVDFEGTYWMSDEDRPPLFSFKSADADLLEIVVGDPDKPMPLLASGDGKVAGVVTTPNHETFRSEQGDHIFTQPDFNYLVLSKNSAWAAPGYASALLIIWDGKPEKITAIAKDGFGSINIQYSNKNNLVKGKVWLYPFPVANQDDMQYVHRNAEHFLKNGKLFTNSFPPQQMLNAIPVGLAAGAYLLSKYKDPMAPTILAHASKAVDAVFEAEKAGKKFVRVFFPLRAAAWMVKTGKILNDQEMVKKYSAYVDLAAQRILSPSSGYDGKGWPSGWDHFNAAKAVWLAADATQSNMLQEAFGRALEVYTIDAGGIYRYGVKMPSPGGFETYFASMPMGVWGLAGKMDWADMLLRLNVPAEEGKKASVKDMWHYGGNGPWAQDDANPEYVGASLKGLNISQKRKYIVPVGAFPVYDATGKVSITKKNIVANPYFLPGTDPIKIIDGTKGIVAKTSAVQSYTPGSAAEKSILSSVSGAIINETRFIKGNKTPLIYQFDISGKRGVGLDFDMRGDGFKIDVSPDGKRWYQRMDTWSKTTTVQSLDLSFLRGSRDELIKILEITPEETGPNSIFKLDLSHVTEGFVELHIGNGYEISCSSDAENWKSEINAKDTQSETGAAWIRMFNISNYLKNGSTVYLRISELASASGYTKPAFLNRITVYGTMKTNKMYVRINNVYDSPDKSLILKGIKLRKW